MDWTGGYFTSGSLYLAAPGTLTGFTLDILSDNAGQPGTVLASDIITGNAGETSSGSLYTYSAALSTPFSAAAGTQYWVSIVADLPYLPQWGWVESTTGNNNSYQDFFGTLSPIAVNEAFTLDGTVTAESAPDGGTTALFLGMSFAVLGFARRKLSL